MRPFSVFVVGLLAALQWGCSKESPPPTSALSVAAPVSAPGDSLAGTSVSSCAVYSEERCREGTLERCAVYDTKATAFTAPSELYDRVLHYERWYELYSSPHGQTAERRFKGPMPGSASEAQWSSAEQFAGWSGLGDSAIWTGTTLNGYIARYLVTGTGSDYQRFEEKVRAALRMFDVTGIKGYLARYFYLDVPAEAPRDDRYVLETDPKGASKNPHTFHVMESPESIDGLPEAFTSGYTDKSGVRWPSTPMWHGTPTIDQFSGMTISLASAYALLKDQSLKDRIAEHMTCYLNRLRRLDVINLQKNKAVLKTLSEVLGGSSSVLDPDDVDPAKLDTFTLYYTAQPNSLNADTFDRSCPAAPATAPQETIDAAAADFEAKVLNLAFDLNGKYDDRKRGIDHYYVPNARGQDAVHMMLLTAMAYYFTGDPVYQRFFDDTLVAELNTIAAARGFLGVILPKVCRKYFEVNISVPPLWALIGLLAPSETKTAMQHVMYEDVWLKDTSTLGNAKFSWMMAAAVPESIAPERLAVAQQATAILAGLGGNDGLLSAPRRTYSIAYQTTEDNLPAGITPTCPSNEEVAVCEKGVELFGLKVDARPITRECTGAPGECAVTGGCVKAVASAPLPMGLRRFADHMWQISPFDMQTRFPVEGEFQSPGTDLTESYWWSRYYGFITQDDGKVLAWENVGTCS